VGRCWLVAALLLVLLGLLAAPAAARHGGIHGYCKNGQPVITERPPGNEDLTVQCNGSYFVVRYPIDRLRDGYDPREVAYPVPPAHDFGGWVSVRINGVKMTIPFDPRATRAEPPPFLVKSTGRVLVPIRFFTQAIGGQVTWDPAGVVTLGLGDLTVVLRIGETTARVGDREVALDQPALIHQGRTFVPLRFVMEAFGAQVGWDSFHSVAHITLTGPLCQNPVYCGGKR
jgi:hypothetical protein